MRESEDSDSPAASDGTPLSHDSGAPGGCDLPGSAPPAGAPAAGEWRTGAWRPAPRERQPRSPRPDAAFERGDLLLLDANVPGAERGAYVFAARLDDHAFLYGVTEDATGAPIASQEHVYMVPVVALRRFQRLGSRLIPLGS